MGKYLTLAVMVVAGVALSAQAAPAEHDMKTGSFLTTIPGDALLISNIHTQPVYDTNENKLGKIEDLILDRGGKVQAVVVSVGGFIGIGDKDVMVPFEAVKTTERGNKTWLTIDATKDSLKSAPPVSLDTAGGRWIVKSK